VEKGTRGWLINAGKVLTYAARWLAGTVGPPCLTRHIQLASQLRDDHLGLEAQFLMYAKKVRAMYSKSFCANYHQNK